MFYDDKKKNIFNCKYISSIFAFNMIFQKRMHIYFHIEKQTAPRKKGLMPICHIYVYLFEFINIPVCSSCWRKKRTAASSLYINRKRKKFNEGSEKRICIVFPQMTRSQGLFKSNVKRWGGLLFACVRLGIAWPQRPDVDSFYPAISPRLWGRLTLPLVMSKRGWFP